MAVWLLGRWKGAIMTEHDRKQYRLMLEGLDAFGRGATGAVAIVADLEGLLKALEQPDQSWGDEFMRWLGRIHIANAVAVHRSAKSWSEEEADELRAAAAHLETMIRAKIADIPEQAR